MNLEPAYLRKKWAVALQILPLLGVIIVLKFILHYLGWEVLSLNPLFTSIVAATTFLLGFLITGVLADYKESEKIPGEMAASLAAISDEAVCIQKSKNCLPAKELLEHISGLAGDIIHWFHKQERTKLLLQKISDLNEHFVLIEPYTQATFLSRLKQEQSNLRRAVIRSHAIRETTFFLPAYAIAEALAFFLIIGMLILKLEPFWESIFFVMLVSFVVLYMIYLIKDLDNPFDYSGHDEESNEVSLKPLHDVQSSLEENLR
jgi:hypothetical protein